MALLHRQTRLTYDDYCLLPEDGRRHEIMAGEHFVSPAPTVDHQRVSGNLYFLLRSFLETHPYGELLAAPLDVVLSRHDVVQPDLVYISTEKKGIVTEANVQGAPELLVEILSRSTRDRDLDLKLKLYERFGVGEYWIVDPEAETVTIYRLAGGRLQETAQLAPPTEIRGGPSPPRCSPASPSP